MPTKQTSSSNACMWCGKADCKCLGGTLIVKGIVLILFGYLLIRGILDLTNAIAYLLILAGVVKLLYGFKSMSKK